MPDAKELLNQVEKGICRTDLKVDKFKLDVRHTFLTVTVIENKLSGKVLDSLPLDIFNSRLYCSQTQACFTQEVKLGELMVSSGLKM